MYIVYTNICTYSVNSKDNHKSFFRHFRHLLTYEEYQRNATSRPCCPKQWRWSTPRSDTLPSGVYPSRSLGCNKKCVLGGLIRVFRSSRIQDPLSFFFGGVTSSQNLSGFSCPGAFRKCPSLLGKGGMVPQILRCARSTAHIPTCVPFAWSGTWSGSKKSLKSQTRSSRFCQGAERLESEDTKSRIPQH